MLGHIPITGVVYPCGVYPVKMLAQGELSRQDGPADSRAKELPSSRNRTYPVEMEWLARGPKNFHRNRRNSAMQVTVVVGTISHWDNVAGTRPAGFTIAYLFEKMRLRWGRLLRSREWAQEGSWSGSLIAAEQLKTIGCCLLVNVPLKTHDAIATQDFTDDRSDCSWVHAASEDVPSPIPTISSRYNDHQVTGLGDQRTTACISSNFLSLTNVGRKAKALVDVLSCSVFSRDRLMFPQSHWYTSRAD
ncbi:hypothetical protein PCASD_07278 [Puccinia coronata f. sp. avenae]|uniref:Uncharacterized protein n=1 Tax=Puccinia coronata f. sp. avenae TaxID=200324 RepID=A0A2N5URG6_9BASI|nr:hypothetical protein PCASD_07278 [Puccinia coronata f. sp. avenae]